MSPGELEDDEMGDEYDFSNGRPNPYAARMKEHGRLILLAPDLYEVFPDSDSVNEALRLLMKAGAAVGKKREERAS